MTYISCGEFSEGGWQFPCVIQTLWYNTVRSARKVKLVLCLTLISSLDFAKYEQQDGLKQAKMFDTWRRRQVARQGSAKPSSWVQIPSSPQKKRAEPPLFLL